jgi:hypothetical protein
MGGFRLHTQCFWVACEFPIESSDDLKMFLHVSVHVQYQSWELKQLFSPVLQMSFLGLGLLRSWNCNNCSAQYCKVYFLRLVLPYSLFTLFLSRVKAATGMKLFTYTPIPRHS